MSWPMSRIGEEMKKMNKAERHLSRSLPLAFRRAGVVVVVMVFLLLAVSQGSAQPALPHLFYGELHADGSPAPAGTVVEARVNGEVRGSITTTEVGIYATFSVNPLLVQGVASGATIEFYANGVQCNEVATFQLGRWTELDLTVTGPLVPPEYSLTVITVGQGSVTKLPDQGTYASGTSVELDATADPGWTFSAWSGDLSGTTNPDSIIMDGVKTVTATFTQDQYTLTVNIVGGGSVTKLPDQPTYAYNDVVQLDATADPGWTFSAWTGGLSGSADPENITMDGDKIVTATFVESTAPVPGDANGDGHVNALDITKVERIIAGLDEATPGADANCDGHVNALDITKTERIIAGLDPPTCGG